MPLDGWSRVIGCQVVTRIAELGSYYLEPFLGATLNDVSPKPTIPTTVCKAYVDALIGPGDDRTAQP